MDLIVVGAGWAGEAHVKAIQALQREGVDCSVAALVDTDRDHLARVAGGWGVEATYTDLPSALKAHPRAEGVVLATPHWVHREGMEQAAEAGRHVLVEKPMALTLEDADAMIAACDRSGTTLMVAESARYQLPSIAIRDTLQTGKIGQVLSGRINQIYKGKHTYSYPGRRGWLADPEVCGGGIWMLNGIHTMSKARMWLGDVKRVYAREVHSERFESPLEATIVALVSFDSGAELTITVSAELHGYKRFGDVALFGSDGTVYLRSGKEPRLEIYTQGEPEIIEFPKDERSGAGGAFVRQMEEFFAAVKQKREPFTSGPSERETIAAILAGYDSIRTGKAIDPG